MRIPLTLLALVALAAPAAAQRRGPGGGARSRVPEAPVRTSLTKEQKLKLSPSQEDVARHREFLMLPNTGIAKLLPDLGCDDNRLVVRADSPCLEYIPESSYYSFRKREHTADVFADIRLKSGFFVSDGILAQGILVKLGDVPIQEVSIESAGVGFLRQYQPKSEAREAQDHFERFIAGVSDGRFEYRKAIPVSEDSTYALRVVAYRGSIIRTSRLGRYDILADDRRIDILVAFRVVSRAVDGSVTIVWRELERKQSPKLIRPKGK